MPLSQLRGSREPCGEDPEVCVYTRGLSDRFGTLLKHSSVSEMMSVQPTPFLLFPCPVLGLIYLCACVSGLLTKCTEEGLEQGLCISNMLSDY